ncbi:MAG: GNAT family N-acetyltransferase [Desulfobulbaceae bacterium]|nr:GNAT family N-acetyltransferase [Desulfobulbaceae bacterium]
MSDIQVKIRPAVSSDVEVLTSLLEILFSIEEDFFCNKPLQRRGLELMLSNERCCVLVAEVNGQVVGMCSGQLTISTAEGGPALLVEDMVVLGEYRGQGIGQRLLAEVAGWGETQGVSRLQLLADRNNAQGLKFYKKLGWQTTELICLRKTKACS